MARSAQTFKSISFIWIVWRTLYVYISAIETEKKYLQSHREAWKSIKSEVTNRSLVSKDILSKEWQNSPPKYTRFYHKELKKYLHFINNKVVGSKGEAQNTFGPRVNFQAHEIICKTHLINCGFEQWENSWKKVPSSKKRIA